MAVSSQLSISTARFSSAPGAGARRTVTLAAIAATGLRLNPHRSIAAQAASCPTASAIRDSGKIPNVGTTKMPRTSWAPSAVIRLTSRNAIHLFHFETAIYAQDVAGDVVGVA